MATLRDVIWESVLPNLDFISSGKAPPNPAEIPGSKRMTEFIKEMSMKYDIVLFDSPPVLSVIDSVVLSVNVDGTILVVSSGKTYIPTIERSMEALGNVGGKFLGIVLNNFDPVKAYGGYYPRSHRDYAYAGSPYTQEPAAGKKDKGARG